MTTIDPETAFVFVLLLSIAMSTTSSLSLYTRIVHHSPTSSTTTSEEPAKDRTTPWTVLVHGLDSSSATWKSTMEQLGSFTSVLAYDQRGSGYSPLGTIQDFSQDALVEDLDQLLRQHQIGCSKTKKIVLVGHSLGGRIALGYASKYPEKIASLVIEDMDIAARDPNVHGIVRLVQPPPYQGSFQRQRNTKEEVVQALVQAGYPLSGYIDKALNNGRIEPTPPNLFNNETIDNNNNNNIDNHGDASTTWWSHINPDFRTLCYKHVLGTTQGQKDCIELRRYFDENNNNNNDNNAQHTNAATELLFPCHVFVAGPEGTVCIEESLQDMQRILGNSHLTIHRFPNAGHSIHSTAPSEYLETLKSIIVGCC